MSVADFPRPMSVTEAEPAPLVPWICAGCHIGIVYLKPGVALFLPVTCRVCQSSEWEPA